MLSFGLQHVENRHGFTKITQLVYQTMLETAHTKMNQKAQDDQK